MIINSVHISPVETPQPCIAKVFIAPFMCYFDALLDEQRVYVDRMHLCVWRRIYLCSVYGTCVCESVGDRSEE